jgi:hypothetical protein
MVEHCYTVDNIFSFFEIENSLSLWMVLRNEHLVQIGMQFGKDIVDEIEVILGGKLSMLQSHIVLAHLRVQDADLQLQLAQHCLVLHPKHVFVPVADQLPAEVFKSECRGCYLAITVANYSLASYKNPT